MSDTESRALNLTHLRRRSVVGMMRAWREITGSAREAMGAELRPGLPKEDLEILKRRMRDCLNAKGGEVTARARTADLGRFYLSLKAEGRAKFLRALAESFDIDREKLSDLAQEYMDAPESGSSRRKLETKLREALEPPRSIILRQFTALPDGFRFLVNLRSDLAPLIARDAALAGLEYDLKHILSGWFDVGLLDLVQVSWLSPAALLEKLIEYESVHRVASWEDLKNRLDADRRVFAFLHPKMPLEPLIFVHVALVKGMSDNVQKLLDASEPLSSSDEADTAIFYSISNAQKGLAGISFGNFLIKRVVSELTRELPQLKNFATLSPIPGFRSWLDVQLEQNETLLKSSEASSIAPLIEGEEPAQKKLLHLLNSPWNTQKLQSDTLKPILLRLCAHYLLEEKRGKKPLDAVAGFHLFNGSRLERLNWLADTSAKGMKQSAGLMANYYYKLSEIDANHEDFVTEGKIVASRAVKSYS